MCGPALVAPLMIASTALTAAGQLQSGLYASQVARNQAIVAGQNKALKRENIADSITQGQDEQRRLGREIAQRVGSQQARLAANNVDITSGSAARVVGDTQMIGREDSMTLAENMRRQIKAQQIDVWSLESEKRAAQAEARQAKTAAAFSVGSTILGGATQYAKFKAKPG